MKRVFLLCAFICMIALMGVSADEAAAYEPVSIQQALSLDVCFTEIVVVKADPLQTDLAFSPCISSVFAEPVYGVSLNGLINYNNGQTILVNFSPGIIMRHAIIERGFT
jgi:hypothetical protein